MKKMIYVTITLAVIFLSCKKGDAVSPTNNSTIGGDTTIYSSTTVIVPRGPITRSDLYPENGYISGVIEGTTSPGMPFTKSFTHSLDGEMATYYVKSNGDYIIHLNKLDKFGGLDANDKKTDMTFILSNDKIAVRSIDNLQASINIDSSATAITKFNISANASNGFGNVVFANIVFNTADGTFACDYVINVLNVTTSSSKPAKITGKIKTTLTNIRYRTGS